VSPLRMLFLFHTPRRLAARPRRHVDAWCASRSRSVVLVAVLLHSSGD
jgi:hypothetical protein